MRSTAESKDVDTLTVQQLLGDDEVKILDVRTPAEFESAHIPGAYNVPLDVLDRYADRLATAADRATVVTVCQSGVRAQQARERLEASGVATRCMTGGMKAWDASAGPVELGRQRWDLERQVRLAAGSLVLAGIVGSTVYAPLKYLSGAVGAGLAFAALSNTCAMGRVLSKLPYNQGAETDVDEVVARFEGS